MEVDCNFVTYIQIHELDVHELLEAVTEADFGWLMPTSVMTRRGFLRLAPTHHGMVHQFGQLLCLQFACNFGLSRALSVLCVATHINEARPTQCERDHAVQKPMVQIWGHPAQRALNLPLQVDHLMDCSELGYWIACIVAGIVHVLARRPEVLSFGRHN